MSQKKVRHNRPRVPVGQILKEHEDGLAEADAEFAQLLRDFADDDIFGRPHVRQPALSSSIYDLLEDDKGTWQEDYQPEPCPSPAMADQFSY